MNSIFHRTSIRKYLENPVEDIKIEQILRAAMAAPSAANQQPWEYYVVTNKSKLKQLGDCSPYASCVKDAPMAFVACYRKKVMFPQYAQIDMSASVENLLLEADAQGLGAVWLGIAPLEERMERVREVLAVTAELEVFAIIPCGYPVNVEVQQDRYDESRIHYIE